MSDIGRRNGSASFDVYHSSQFFTPISGGEYEAFAGRNDGTLRYRGNRNLLTIDDISIVEDTPIEFGPAGEADDVSFSAVAGNLFNDALLVDIDGLLFDVAPSTDDTSQENKCADRAGTWLCRLFARWIHDFCYSNRSSL